MEHGTKLLALENVVTGSVHRLSSDTFGAEGSYGVKVVHVSTDDVGYGCCRRYRGWPLAP